MIIAWLTSANLTVPVETKTYLVQLLTIAFDVSFSCDSWMLSSLYGILLCGKTVCIIAHRVEHVESLLTFETSVDVACDITQRMAYVQSCSARIWEHVQHIVFLFACILGHFVGFLLHPALLPFFLNLSEIVFHFLIIMCIWPQSYEKSRAEQKKLFLFYAEMQ